MVTITDNTRRITAIRECIDIATAQGFKLTGWEIARLSIAYQAGHTTPQAMLTQAWPQSRNIVNNS